MALTMQLLILVLLPAAFILPPAARAGEIIGGQETRPHSRPYMALVNIEAGGGGGRCGGFLIREDVVVTAAHCNCNWCTITVLLGAHNVFKEEPGRQEIPVRHRIPHPDYNDKTFDNDIMLLQLEHKAFLSEQVNTICLPLADQRVPPGTMCSVAGWGRTRPQQKFSSARLREVDIEVLEDGACLKDPDGTYRHYNATTMICVGGPTKGKDSAKGDFGGPLVCGQTAQGIVSWGPITPPGVYTRVSTFIPWIQKTMRKMQP